MDYSKLAKKIYKDGTVYADEIWNKIDGTVTLMFMDKKGVFKYLIEAWEYLKECCKTKKLDKPLETVCFFIDRTDKGVVYLRIHDNDGNTIETINCDDKRKAVQIAESIMAFNPSRIKKSMKELF